MVITVDEERNKPLPLIPIDEASPAEKVNKCIECGFCEVNCLSCGFTPVSYTHLLSFTVSMVKYSLNTLLVLTIIVQLGIVSEASIAAAIASAGVAVSLALQGGLSNFRSEEHTSELQSQR